MSVLAHVDELVIEWRPCWWCALPLDVDEPDLCDRCAAELDPLGPGITLHRSWDIDSTFDPLKHIDVGLATSAAIDQHLDQVANAAQAWAVDHQLSDDAAGRYRGQARGRCHERLLERAAADLDALGWARQHAADRKWQALIATARKSRG